MVFARQICEYCNYYKYKDSDYGRLGADHYTCTQNTFNSTRDDEWFDKAKACKLFHTSFRLSEEKLKEIGRT
jgi:outer membrane receptor for Fe3+-dicitrate